MSQIITRFAPSPTGYIHVGNLRTALMNYLIAKKAGGHFILRIDDTDAERSKQEYVDQIKRDLEWLGLEWDQVEHQSARLDLYHAAADNLREMQRFYEVFETPAELDLKRKKQRNMGKPPVYDRAALKLSEEQKAELRAERDGYWRFLLDQARIDWEDMILGALSIDAASLSDPVLIRADGQILYTLASVVDDTDMGVTHVVRGSDHVTNTATQIQIIGALGHSAPNFGHHSLLTGPAGEALSKRIGSLSIKELRENGVEAAALLSLLARLGSSQPVELLTDLENIAETFDLSHFGAAPTKFDEEQLTPLTARALALMPENEVDALLATYNIPASERAAFWEAIHENISKRADIAKWWEICQHGATPDIAPEDADYVAAALALLPPAPRDATSWQSWTAAVKTQSGRKGKALFMPLRKALTGKAHGPDMGKLLPLLKSL